MPQMSSKKARKTKKNKAVSQINITLPVTTPIFQVQVNKVIHNDVEYQIDFNLINEKSAFFKDLLTGMKTRINMHDLFSDHIFEQFIDLVHNKPVEIQPEDAPELIDILKRYGCPTLLAEIEENALQSNNVDLIIEFCIHSPKTFPNLLEYIDENLDLFKEHEKFNKLPISLIAPALYETEGMIKVHDSYQLYLDLKKMLDPENDTTAKSDLLVEKAQIDEEVYEIKQRISRADTDFSKVTQKMQELERACVRYKEEIDDRKKSIQILRTEIQQDQSSIEQLKKEIALLEKETQTLLKEKDEIEEKIVKQKKG